MPSVKNPNTVGRVRAAANRAKARKATRQTQRRARQPDRAAQADARRGARAGLLPTSGPRARPSKKATRKAARQLAHALRRRAAQAPEARGEAVMADVHAAGVRTKKELKMERDAAIEALGRMDIK